MQPLLLKMIKTRCEWEVAAVGMQALSMQGWEWVDEGKTGGPPKLGWRTVEPERSITLNVRVLVPCSLAGVCLAAPS